MAFFTKKDKFLPFCEPEDGNLDLQAKNLNFY